MDAQHDSGVYFVLLVYVIERVQANQLSIELYVIIQLV